MTPVRAAGGWVWKTGSPSRRAKGVSATTRSHETVPATPSSVLEGLPSEYLVVPERVAPLDSESARQSSSISRTGARGANFAIGVCNGSRRTSNGVSVIYCWEFARPIEPGHSGKKSSVPRSNDRRVQGAGRAYEGPLQEAARILDEIARKMLA